MRISARNQLKGTIVKVVEGAVNGVVTRRLKPTLLASLLKSSV